MSIDAHSLYQTASGTVDANGDLTIFFAGAGTGRTWQGSVSLINGTGGKTLNVFVGGQPYGTLSTPGPGGPYQLLENQSLTLTGSGLTVGTVFTAILAGVDEPKENASTYTGPTTSAQVTLGGP